MRSFLLTIVALLPAAAAVQVRITTDVSTIRHGKPVLSLNPNGSTHCAPTDNHEQCAALVDLYNATNGDKWTNSTGWLSGTSYCGWYNSGRIMCDRHGNVIEL